MRTAHRTPALAAAITLLCLPVILEAQAAATQAATAQAAPTGRTPLGHIIVLYMENRSFDNLYGSYPGANGIRQAAGLQVDDAGVPYATLPRPLDTRKRPAAVDPRFPSALPNRLFEINGYVPAGTATGDLVHRFYQEQYQIDGGKMDRFVAGSDAAGLSMGYYETTLLPMFDIVKQYTLEDNFFHAAFGGSFLNHFWLIAARSPVWPNAPQDIVAKLDKNGKLLKDGIVTPDGFAVNTAFTVFAPHPANVDASHLVPAQTFATIGDRLSDKGISWAWYSGGWDDAVAGQPDPLFQFHHQPFAFFEKYGDGTPGRAQHVKDERDFIAAVKDGSLPAVTFVKPLGEKNEHPGYTDLEQSERWLHDTVTMVQNSPVWKDSAIIITYDENGGQYDHVAPPVIDQWGPGTRVPTIVISPYARKGFVDHTQMDTTSILALIEYQYGLAPLSTRDAAAANMLTSFEFPTAAAPGASVPGASQASQN